MDNVLIVLGVMLFCGVLFSPMYFISKWRERKFKVVEQDDVMKDWGKKDFIAFFAGLAVLIGVLTFLIHISTARTIVIALLVMFSVLILGNLWIRIKG